MEELILEVGVIAHVVFADSGDPYFAGVVGNEYDVYDFEKEDDITRQKRLNMASASTPKAPPTKTSSTSPTGTCTCGTKKKTPKIFFCTRTHRQIAQIIRELNKTEFNTVSPITLSRRQSWH